MGIVVFTDEANVHRFMDGPFIEMRGWEFTPTAPDITYIVRDVRLNKEQCEYLAGVVPYRLVSVSERKPNVSESECNSIILEGQWGGEKKNWNRAIDAMLRWDDRNRVYQELVKVPVPYLLAYVRENIKDIELWRRINEASFEVPERVIQALLAHRIKSARHYTHPKRKKKDSEITPEGFRDSDVYAGIIVAQSDSVANEVRAKDVDSLPKGVKKRKQKTTEWL
tara:strand:+ start:4120 stop:4791 length:672 start_codon:yes stop_codon:yes gene_type:complete